MKILLRRRARGDGVKASPVVLARRKEISAHESRRVTGRPAIRTLRLPRGYMLLALGVRSFRNQHSLHDLIGDLPDTRGRVRQKQGIGAVAFADGF